VNKWLSVLAGLSIVLPASAATEDIYLGAAYLNSDTEFGSHSGDTNGFELNLGYSFNNYLAAEVGYLDFGTLNLPEIPDSGGRVNSDGLAMQIVVRYPVRKFTLYGELGNLWWNSDADLTTIAGPVEQDTDGNDLMYGVGLGYDLTSHFAINIDVKATNFAHSNIVTMGARYRF
jgi:hypothetical protein